ncbi:MAG: response regulator, partial [Spirochaetia bacterium]|nr:response regulator [Spirochaetia bacterium]
MSKIQKQNILVVEDDPIQQDILKHVLAKLDFNVLTASDGKHCLEILKTEIPGMIMLDFHMPDMSGFQILKELKSHNKLSKIPVLMMSIDSSDESAILCISSGANGYIRKPINMHELILKMNNLLDLNIDRNQADGLIEDIMNPDTRVTIGQTPYILNYILGNEELQKTKASCTFASILSIRIHGLATLVSELESDKIQILLDEVIANISNIVYRNKGSINLFFNDLIICTFGIPMVYDNDTINALLCAEQLKKYEASFLKFAGKLTNLRIEMSTAITSGKIYYGSINA